MVAADLPGPPDGRLTMSSDAAVQPVRARYRLLACAAEAHLAWAHDFALPERLQAYWTPPGRK
jgi:hypothetical protein